jgi:hypothetical protein
LHYVVVRPTKQVALERAQARGDEELAPDGPVETMFEAFRALAPTRATSSVPAPSALLARRK